MRIERFVNRWNARSAVVAAAVAGTLGGTLASAPAAEAAPRFTITAYGDGTSIVVTTRTAPRNASTCYLNTSNTWLGAQIPSGNSVRANPSGVLTIRSAPMFPSPYDVTMMCYLPNAYPAYSNPVRVNVTGLPRLS